MRRSPCKVRILGMLGLLLALVLAVGYGQAALTPLNFWVWWTEGGNPVLVAELQANFAIHDTYVYMVWDYSDGTTITDVWYFEQTLLPGNSIPLYAPRSHLNPWAQVVGLKAWYFDYSPGIGRCTYNKLAITQTSAEWRGSRIISVRGTVKNSGRIPTAYVVFAALYDTNGKIIDANGSSEGVKANSTDDFVVYFLRLDSVPGAHAGFKSWVFQGQFGWQNVGCIFPEESRTSPGLRNVCPEE